MPLSLPIVLGPTAAQKIVHVDGEIAAARAAGSAGIIFVLSSFATSSIEEIAEAAPDTLKWLQVCLFKKRRITAGLVRRAERVGFKGIVLNIDANAIVRRFQYFNFRIPSNLEFANFRELNIPLNDFFEKGVKFFTRTISNTKIIVLIKFQK